jgi:malate synthase
MNKRINEHGYKIADCLYNLVNHEVLPGLQVNQQDFWQDVANVFNEFMPRNKALLATRETLQSKIDAWHLDNLNNAFSQQKYQQFLTEIGYLVPEQSDFQITTENVDAEVALIAGPQLVVPLMNARFALNAANARWGSLYDALYGSDVIVDEPNENVDSNEPAGYNPIRGQKVQTFARNFLDDSLPLGQGSHHDAVKYKVDNQQLIVELNTGSLVNLKDITQFVGFNGTTENPSAILCIHNGLHVEIQIDENNLIGQTDTAGVKDVVLESALSTIQDCEDSIAAVDAADKTAVYANWLGLMKGDLAETISKGGKQTTRMLNPDRTYLSAAGKPISLPGRSLQFIRNVGHLMTTDAILTANDEEVPEGILDALITSLIAVHDLNGSSKFVNSKHGSIYIVKPKMHGPEEVQFSNVLFSRIEAILSLNKNTIKMGIMDEERRTSANLKECIRAASTRVAFINTGFLDRTGDEIHTSMLAGPMVRKELMKNEKWISSYENRNVVIGLQAGFKGKAQIGKGMWATPDEMAAMLQAKIGHPKSGASCAWVPSPTAATLHVMHYHYVNVSQVQQQMLTEANAVQANLNHDKLSEDNLSQNSMQSDSQLDALLTIPLLNNITDLSEQERQDELDNNVQGLLGYVVRWVNQGVGCSKVPDINNVGRMEDRATLRISSQHICNWLHHGLLSADQVMQTLKRMAAVVDTQNEQDSSYIAMAPNFDSSLAFQAAVDLIFKGKTQPSGYTEPLLHKMRNKLKQSLAS